MKILLRSLLAASFVLLAACKSGPTEEEKRAALAAKREAEAALQLKHFDEALIAGRNDLALNFSDYIQRNFPQSQAAATVKPKADALRAKVESERRATALREMWAYHSTDDAAAGGRVRTAYVYSVNAQPDAVDDGKLKARLVLRRHPQWGDDVYVLSDRGNFSCGTPCTVKVTFDGGQTRTYPASLPETGEPAIFVEDFEPFVRALQDAERVRIDVVLKDGGAQSPEFELGGYDSSTVGPID
jgi:hypothetical protein